MTNKLEQLHDDLHAQIVSLSKQGDALVETGQARQAILLYQQALRLVPEPRNNWETTTWLLAAVGDAYWLLKDVENAYEAFHDALQSPGAVGNPFIHLRMGQVRYELGDHRRAADDLLRAYIGAGDDVFDGEDPKYFHLIADLL